MKLGRCLECVMHGDEKRRLAYGSQHLSLRFRMFSRFTFLHNGGLFEDFHGEQLAFVHPSLFARQEDFTVGTRTKDL